MGGPVFAVIPALLPEYTVAKGKGAVTLLRAAAYTTETHTARLGDKTVAVEGKTPRLSPEEYQEQHDEIQYALYDIFIQYEDGTQAAGV